jgi:hypothetical protein
MKKGSTVAAQASRKISAHKLTVGLDLGDRSSWYCVLDEAGTILQEQKLEYDGQGAAGRVRWYAGWDAQTLARLARIDPGLLSPAKHRSRQGQADLTTRFRSIESCRAFFDSSDSLLGVAHQYHKVRYAQR